MSIDSPAGVAARRGLLKTAGFGAAALGALAIAGRSTPAAADGTVTPVDVLNFALNLEYLEAEFYLRATTGSGLPKSLTNGGSGAPAGTVTGGSAVPFQSSRLKAIAHAIAMDEMHHVVFLRDALAGARVAEPAIDLSTSFTTLARAAGIVGPTGTFNPFDNEDDFVLGAYIFEDVGVSAYSGAAGYLANTPYLAPAAGILATEAYHAGALRALLIDALPTLAPTADSISQLRAQLSGAKDDVGPAYYNGRVVNVADADSNSIAFARTPQQVLSVVYGAQNASSGLFFPNGVNGAIS